MNYDSFADGRIDPDRERKRLADVYGRMAEGELEHLAKEAGELTPLAREALRAEIERRELSISLQDAPAGGAEPVWRRPVTIRLYRDLPDALVAKSILDSAGIRSFLADENLVRMDWFLSNAIGCVKLWVNEEDARALLGAEIPSELAVEGQGEYKHPRCPRCQSFDISFEELDKRKAYAGFFIRLPIPWKRRRWKCNSCGNEWQAAYD
jgi:hypothetical protein